MKRFIIRLDDATPTMNWCKWRKIEKLLDLYKITPIVGVIPDNKDKDFSNLCEGDFWQLVKNWEYKGWTIAQHGLEHVIEPCGKLKFFQNTHEYRSEFAGKSYEKQYEMLNKGYSILRSHGIIPVCFFAPAHTFDDNTVKAAVQLGYYRFISDGFAFRPYQKCGMCFLPSLFDTPHYLKGLGGVYTFVYHPNNMQERDFLYLEQFLNKYALHFTNAEIALEEASIYKRQGVAERCLEWGIPMIRKVKEKINNYGRSK